MRDPRPTSRSRAARNRSAFFLLLLLALPVGALIRFSPHIHWLMLVAPPVLLSVITFFLYGSDKARAEDGRWRIPEWILHLVALAGGWPGAFLGQRTFRHKTAKTSFQIIFWMIVFLYQLIALDSLLDGRIGKGIWR